MITAFMEILEICWGLCIYKQNEYAIMRCIKCVKKRQRCQINHNKKRGNLLFKRKMPKRYFLDKRSIILSLKHMTQRMWHRIRLQMYIPKCKFLVYFFYANIIESFVIKLFKSIQ